MSLHAFFLSLMETQPMRQTNPIHSLTAADSLTPRPGINAVDQCLFPPDQEAGHFRLAIAKYRGRRLACLEGFQRPFVSQQAKHPINLELLPMELEQDGNQSHSGLD